jgi:hypothetical protein
MLLNFVVAGAGTVKSASHLYVAGRLRPLEMLRFTSNDKQGGRRLFAFVTITMPH